MYKFIVLHAGYMAELYKYDTIVRQVDSEQCVV